MPSAISESMLNFRYFLWQLGISVLGASLVWFVVLALFPPQPSIAVVDVHRLIAQFVQSKAKQNLPQDQLKKQSMTFGQILENVMQALAKEQHLTLLPKKEQHLTLLPKEAVIAGAKDITPAIQEKLDAQLKPLYSPHRSFRFE